MQCYFQYIDIHFLKMIIINILKPKKSNYNFLRRFGKDIILNIFLNKILNVVIE